MATEPPSDQPALYDPDDWLGWWKELHPDGDLLRGAVGHLALRALAGQAIEDAVGSEVLEVADSLAGKTFKATVEYVVQQRPRGRVFHLVSLRGVGDPDPPWLGA